MSKFNLYQISPEEFEMFSAMEKISADDILPVMQRFSSGKVGHPMVGKLAIVNRFFPNFKNTVLREWEGTYVFYALAKFKPSLFSKPFYRMFIWRPRTMTIASVDVETVTFGFVDERYIYRERFLLFEDETKEDVYTTECNGKKHTLTQEKRVFWREYRIQKDAFVCRADLCRFYLSWSDPDRWVDTPYSWDCERAPMYFLRHDYDKESAPHHDYPRFRPSHGEIDE